MAARRSMTTNITNTAPFYCIRNYIKNCNEYKLVERENKKGLQEKSKEITSKCPIHNLLNQIYERQIFDS